MDLRKLAVNMVPFPIAHFLVTSFSPLQARQIAPYQNHTEHSLIQQMFEKTNQMLLLNSHDGKYLTATGVFRGRTLSIQMLHDLIAKEKQKQAFVPWIANNVRNHADGNCNMFCCSLAV